MRPVPFEYQAPRAVLDAARLLGSAETPVVVLAGGQTLVPLMNKRAICPRVVVDIKRVEGLRAIDVPPTGPGRIGALVSHEQLRLSSKVLSHWPVLVAASKYVSNPVVRRRGTVGGSLAWRDGRSEIAAALVACDAEIVATSSAGGTRRIAAVEVLGRSSSGLCDDELITEVVLERSPAGSRTYGVTEVAPRRWDPALGGAVCQLAWDDRAGQPVDAHVVAFGELSAPSRLERVEDALRAGADSALVRDAAESDVTFAVRELGATRDRGHLAAVLVETTCRALELARTAQGK